MPRDPLETVRWLRSRAVDEILRSLAEAIKSASAATDAARAAERDIELEADRASNTQSGDNLVEAFAAWLPAARTRVAEARALAERQEAEVARLRAELAASRTALEVIEALLADREATESRQEAHKLQLALDEIAGRPPQ